MAANLLTFYHTRNKIIITKEYTKEGMILNTQLSNDIDITAYKSAYDECCKSLLAHKSILAHILKECVSEFKDYDTKYIAENCIENNPEISKASVHRNSKDTEKITGISTEDKTIDEGAVYYDIRFVATLPETNESIRLIINIEAQNSYHPGYSLVRRGLYYCCRLISSQYETEFTGSDYDNIKKVYSIWICTNTPANVQNTITRYKIAEENIIGNVKEKVKNYDVMNVIMVCLDKDSENVNNNQNGILKMLRILLSDRVNPISKKVILDDDFDVELDVKELNNMCNLSDGVYIRGKTEGIDTGKIEALKNLMQNLKLSFEQAATAIGLSENEKSRYADKI